MYFLHTHTHTHTLGVFVSKHSSRTTAISNAFFTLLLNPLFHRYTVVTFSWGTIACCYWVETRIRRQQFIESVGKIVNQEKKRLQRHVDTFRIRSLMNSGLLPHFCLHYADRNGKNKAKQNTLSAGNGKVLSVSTTRSAQLQVSQRLEKVFEEKCRRKSSGVCVCALYSSSFSLIWRVNHHRLCVSVVATLSYLSARHNEGGGSGKWPSILVEQLLVDNKNDINKDWRKIL